MNPSAKHVYNSPFESRWCRKSPLLWWFSEQNKAELWRQLWIWLAEAEREHGLDSIISEEMIAEMKIQKGNIDWEKLRKREMETKHDVMAHIHVYGEACPKAAGIIHLGATSCFVQDNADLIIQKHALEHVLQRTAVCLDRLADFAEKYAEMPIVGRTHYQPASMTTIGKRATIWAEGLLHSFNLIKSFHSNLHFRGVKGAVGNQDTLMHLYNGNSEKVKAVDESVTKKAGFESKFNVCGQTYPRYQDTDVIYSLSSLASAANKFAEDIRLSQQIGEMSEPFETKQAGSSAMPYKQNPMLCERICGLARSLRILVLNALETYAHQGFERTLDDSANRRIVIPEAFMTADAILSTLQNVVEGLKIDEEVVKCNVRSSNAVLERALMLLTERGESRQRAHERLKQIALWSNNGNGNKQDLESMFAELPEIADELRHMCEQPLQLSGRAPEQTREFINIELRPAIAEVLATVQDAGERRQLDI